MRIYLSGVLQRIMLLPLLRNYYTRWRRMSIRIIMDTLKCRL